MSVLYAAFVFLVLVQRPPVVDGGLTGGGGVGVGAALRWGVPPTRNWMEERGREKNEAEKSASQFEKPARRRTERKKEGREENAFFTVETRVRSAEAGTWREWDVGLKAELCRSSLPLHWRRIK